MSLIGRLRLGSSALALLAAILLVMPMFDCALTGADTHSHVHTDGIGFATAHSDIPLTAAAHAAGSVAAVHPPWCACSPHAGHCVLKSVLPSSSWKTPTLLLLTMAMMAALGAVAIAPPHGVGVRGPPPVRVPAGRGRLILTHFCIARR
ncbi:hypothetical protein [Nocardia nepalensis]|uniref:hypothetical protein n=1 Tax=Nocardia nepalensis TaxID=3375448 RepID=UPI003B67F387